MDRLARSLTHLIETVNHLASQRIVFRSVTENIDTSSATGQLVFHIFGALAEFERNLIKERTIAGIVAARARGKSGGRPKRSPKASKLTLARKLYTDKSNTVEEIVKLYIYPERRFIDMYENEKISFAEWLLHIGIIDNPVCNTL